jgi:hypothetical protein
MEKNIRSELRTEISRETEGERERERETEFGGWVCRHSHIFEQVMVPTMVRG